jgi:endo-1,4-beta-xylanase
VSQAVKQQTSTSLRQAAAAKGILYGAAARQMNLITDATLNASYIRECGILVPEWELKWDAVQPEPNRYDFSRADWLLNFAQSHQMQFRGHTLVWNQALPAWFRETVNSKNAEQALTRLITTVVGRYAGKIHSWDVVNEAVEPREGRSDGLRQTPWLELLGPEHIELAYRIAAAADPKALLVYNDDSMGYDTPFNDAKRTAVLKFLERLKAKNVPIHALGLESHLGWDALPTENFNPQKLRRFLSDVSSLGLKILITELDVIDRDLPFEIAKRDQTIADIYRDYLAVVLDEPAVIAVLNWGLSDRATWLSQYAARRDGAPARPLPLDLDCQPKLAWHSMIRAFEQAPARR